MKFRVRELAREREMTAEDLARAADLKYSAVKNLWQGRTGDPKYSTLRAVARALKVPVEQLEAGEPGNRIPAPSRA
jgi:transcriptional regulator with XRE-family HTH domain